MEWLFRAIVVSAGSQTHAAAGPGPAPAPLRLRSQHSARRCIGSADAEGVACADGAGRLAVREDFLGRPSRLISVAQCARWRSSHAPPLDSLSGELPALRGNGLFLPLPLPRPSVVSFPPIPSLLSYIALPSPSLARPSAISFSRAEPRFLIISASPLAPSSPRPLLITPPPPPRRPFSCLGCSQ